MICKISLPFIVWILVPLLIGGTNSDEIVKIRNRITTINKKLEDLNREKKSILNEIYKIELQYEKETIKKNQIRLKSSRLRSQINQKKIQKKKLQTEIENSKDTIAKVARILYKMRGNSYLTLFAKFNSMDQLFKNYQLLVTLINYNVTEINSIKTNLSKIDRLTRDLQSRQQELLALQNSIERKMVNISRLKRDKMTIIKEINEDRQSNLKYIEELELKAQNLNALISNKSVQNNLVNINVDVLKGKLDWPVRGDIISLFGKKKSTNFDTYIIHNGIEIKPRSSDKIKAVFQGNVVFAKYYGGYGNLIVIQHTKNFYTVYGHCEKMTVKTGDYVQENSIIGLVGDTGSTQVKSLYFEIRRDRKAEDPLQWLAKK